MTAGEPLRASSARALGHERAGGGAYGAYLRLPSIRVQKI